MSVATFKVVRAGPHVTIQDGGRQRLMRFGVPASGAMDEVSYSAANAAVGNPAGWPAMEISLGGLTLQCLEGAVTIAVAGGGFRVTVDGAQAGAWTVHDVAAGMMLDIRPGFWGSWSYLAFTGRLRANEWLGSFSTHGPSGLGGKILSAGDVVTIDDAELRSDRLGCIACPVTARPRHIVRIVLGPQDHYFDADTLRAFISSPFALTSAYDRMGVRLSGPSLKPNADLDMPSEAVLRGSVQVAGDGVATVLLSDHQTTGGYPKIATMIATDLPSFVQLRARDHVRFRPISPKSAIEISRSRSRSHRKYIEILQMKRTPF